MPDAAEPPVAPPDTPALTDAATRRLVWLFAAACGLSAANLYYNQPLLADIGRAFAASPRAVGSVPMLTQVGYAAGMLLIVPLGDVLQRRRLVVALLLAVAVSMAAAAVSRDLAWLAAASLAIGVTTVVPQVLIPLAAQLVPPERRGRAIGTVFMGLLLGILLSRTLSGAIGEWLGWRAVYWIGGAMMVVLAAVLGPLIPAHDTHADLTYAGLLRSVARLVRTQPVLRQAMLSGSLLFAAFSAFWATLAFRLETPPLHYGTRAAGLFGLVGAAGALAAPLVGRFADRVPPRTIITWMCALLLASFGVFYAGGGSLIGLAVGVLVLDLAVQGGQVSNQTRIYAISGGAHSRVNSAYMVAYFAGGSLGSLLGTLAWSAAGWTGVCVVGGGAAGVALLTHLLAGRSRPQSASDPDLSSATANAQ